MTNTENLKKPGKWARLLDLLVKIACSPAMANHVPAGPGGVASGQVGAAARDGRLSRELARCHVADAGPSGQCPGDLGHSNA